MYYQEQKKFAEQNIESQQFGSTVETQDQHQAATVDEKPLPNEDTEADEANNTEKREPEIEEEYGIHLYLFSLLFNADICICTQISYLSYLGMNLILYFYVSLRTKQDCNISASATIT